MKINFNNLKIPVIFHNLRSYDGHIIMHQIGKFTILLVLMITVRSNSRRLTRRKLRLMSINVIPLNTEKYLSFMLDKHLVFIDNLQFLNPSLPKLAANLEDGDMKYIKDIT